MNLSESLEFTQVSGDAPSFTCFSCGKKTKGAGALMAEIKPFEDDDSDVSVVVCDDKCKTDLLANPKLETGLVNLILSVWDNTGELLKSDYMEYFRETYSNLKQ